MRKNELIKCLQRLKGNPEILLFNGAVNDWNSVGEVAESELVKLTFDEYVFLSRARRNDGEELLSLEELRQDYKKEIWADNGHVKEEHIKDGRYKKKSVAYLLAKARNLTAQDRLGQITY
jgi:hypothetical protein